MKWKLLAVSGLLHYACQDLPKYQSSRKFVDLPSRETSSWIYNITDDKGLILADVVEGAVKYGGRILDGACGTEVANLGIQDTLEFSLPLDVYSQDLCFETTYFDAKDRVTKIKMQPFIFNGPPAIYTILQETNQVIDFQEIPNADSYAYSVKGKDGTQRGSEIGLTESLIDLKNSLPLGFHRLLLLAQTNAGKNVKAVNYNINVVPTTTPMSLSYSMQFEKAYYQTRSIKRILIDQSVFDRVTGLGVSGMGLNTRSFPYYQGGFAAFMDDDDAFMRSSLLYGVDKLSVIPLGLSETAKDLPVIIKDFTLFSVLSAAFDDGSLIKGGLEAWTSPLQQTAVKSGDSELVYDFGPMILK
ncbi:MAG: hypothetical protein EOP04_22660 [Proteobacteria bacterium]|nr:MAG: hypothetical protein EOP04_22660 [Pseudomonadota bacterium]